MFAHKKFFYGCSLRWRSFTEHCIYIWMPTFIVWPYYACTSHFATPSDYLVLSGHFFLWSPRKKSMRLIDNVRLYRLTMPTFGGHAHQCECQVVGVTEVVALDLRGVWPWQWTKSINRKLASQRCYSRRYFVALFMTFLATMRLINHKLAQERLNK